MKKTQKIFISIITVILVVGIVFCVLGESERNEVQEGIPKSYEVSIILPDETLATPIEALYTLTGNDLHINDVVFTDSVDKLGTVVSPYTLEELCNYIAQNVPESFCGECYLSVHSYADDPYYTNVYADYAAYEDSNLAELIHTYNEYPACEIILLSADLTESVSFESCSKYIFKKEVDYGED